MTIVQKTQRTQMRGLNAAARRLGCTPSHLHYVLSGARKSAKLERKMKELDIKVVDGNAVEEEV